MRVEFLSRLYVAKILDMPLEKIVEHQMAVCVQQHKKLLKERQLAGSSMEQLTLDFVIGQLDSAILWLEQCAKDFPLSPKA